MSAEAAAEAAWESPAVNAAVGDMLPSPLSASAALPLLLLLLPAVTPLSTRDRVACSTRSICQVGCLTAWYGSCGLHDISCEASHPNPILPRVRRSARSSIPSNRKVS